MLSMVLVVNVRPTSDVAVSTMGDSPLTVTVSVTAATVRLKLMVALRPMVSVMPSRTTFWKPASSAVTSYGPTGRATIRYLPCSSLVVVRTRPVSTFLAVIVAPGTIPPDSSSTTPRMSASVARAACDTPRRRVTRKERGNLVLMADLPVCRSGTDHLVMAAY